MTRNGRDIAPRSGIGTCICCQHPLQIFDWADMLLMRFPWAAEAAAWKKLLYSDAISERAAWRDRYLADVAGPIAAEGSVAVRLRRVPGQPDQPAAHNLFFGR